MPDDIWTTTKAAFGIALMVICALYAAQKLDRERSAQAVVAARGGGPEITGAITPGAPAGPTQTPAD